MTAGSINLRRYRIARRDGDTMHTACVKSGIQLSEARLIDADDARNPPPPEAFMLPGDTLGPAGDEPITTEIGSQPPAHRQAIAVPEPFTAIAGESLSVAPPPTKGTSMPRGKKADDGPTSVEVEKPDYEKAARIYHGDILPAISKRATHDQELSSAHKEVKKVARVHGGAFKTAIKLKGMEFDSQQAFLRDFRGMCIALNIGLERDLFEASDDDGDGDFIPTVAPTPETLATVQ